MVQHFSVFLVSLHKLKIFRRSWVNHVVCHDHHVAAEDSRLLQQLEVRNVHLFFVVKQDEVEGTSALYLLDQVFHIAQFYLDDVRKSRMLVDGGSDGREVRVHFYRNDLGPFCVPDLVGEDQARVAAVGAYFQDPLDLAVIDHAPDDFGLFVAHVHHPLLK